MITQEWIADLAGGRSFVDVGGLWGTISERVSDAAKAGAVRVTKTDIQPNMHELWDKFRARLTEQGIAECRCVSVDIMAADAVEQIGCHDIVHCAGLTHQVSDPIGLLGQLYNLTNDYLILVSMVIPEHLKTVAGDLISEGGQVLFVPALDARQLAVLREHYRDENFKIGSILDQRSERWIKSDGKPNTGPWWWMYTPAFLHRMLEVSGFRVVETAPVWGNWSHGFMCRKT
jgi:hypothetical protein